MEKERQTHRQSMSVGFSLFLDILGPTDLLPNIWISGFYPTIERD